MPDAPSNERLATRARWDGASITLTYPDGSTETMPAEGVRAEYVYENNTCVGVRVTRRPEAPVIVKGNPNA